MSVATIRQADLSDAAELARLRWDFSPEEVASASQSFAEFTEDFAAWLGDALTGGNWVIWVGECENRLVGNVYVQAIAKVPRPGRFEACYGYVTNVYLEPDFRNRGIGTQLLMAAIDRARKDELELLIVWPSEESVEYYKRAGFAPSGEAMELAFYID